MEKRPGKGTFGRLGLPVAIRYLRPISRAKMLWIGLGLGLLIAALGWLDSWWGSGELLSGGPLSSAHATLEQDCATCHAGFSPVADAACSSCHEKLGDELGRYTFAAHYLYRSNDFERLVPSEHETPCVGCHLEHGGRQASISDVPDARCGICHERSAFATDHPEFAFADDPEGDDDALAFPHGHHVREVMKRRGFADLERACLECHQPDPSGRGFEPVSFDRHCDACHLDAGVATPRLAVAAEGAVGVETLETIQASGEPGTDWSFYLDPNEFRLAAGGRLVMKTPLHHRDPWVLHNLRRLRRQLYPDAGLADLLATSAEVAERDPAELYREAVATLEGQARGLRGSPDPEVQGQLDRIDALIARVRTALDDPTTPFDPTEFLLALEQPAELAPETREEIDLVAADLTAPCTNCHRLDRLTIERVEESQTTLNRAEFDHKAHVIQRRCLDCHSRLPILEAVSGTEVDKSLDRSAIYNLPRIADCRQCHRPGLTSARCTTCHLFHPDAGRRSDLLLYQN
jgi:hypothetical protein